ncbi:hypothetical protein VTK73DRAFT_1339 [Phialemonium thermophilum]|uniref:Uncharacterized protein n=1 Tax=Phialemonium thermophilum TaxID=223376 RepID=A0ABR3VTK1_9PEZI
MLEMSPGGLWRPSASTTSPTSRLTLMRYGAGARRRRSGPADPAVGAGLGVHLGLAVDEDGGQRGVGGLPGVDDGRGGGVAQHLADGLDQVLAHDVVLGRGDLQRDVLVGDALDGVAQLAQVVDVGGVGQHGGGEGARLAARNLAGHAEDVLQLGMGVDHVAVEDGGDGRAVLLEHGRRRLDDGGLLRGQRCGYHGVCCEDIAAPGWVGGNGWYGERRRAVIKCLGLWDR